MAELFVVFWNGRHVHRGSRIKAINQFIREIERWNSLDHIFEKKKFKHFIHFSRYLFH